MALEKLFSLPLAILLFGSCLGQPSQFEIPESEQLALEASGELLPPSPLSLRIRRELRAIKTEFPELRDFRHIPRWNPDPDQVIVSPGSWNYVSRINASKYGTFLEGQQVEDRESHHARRLLADRVEKDLAAINSLFPPAKRVYIGQRWPLAQNQVLGKAPVNEYYGLVEVRRSNFPRETILAKFPSPFKSGTGAGTRRSPTEEGTPNASQTSATGERCNVRANLGGSSPSAGRNTYVIWKGWEGCENVWTFAVDERGKAEFVNKVNKHKN